jgi:hypothetical protein
MNRDSHYGSKIKIKRCCPKKKERRNWRGREVERREREERREERLVVLRD